MRRRVSLSDMCTFCYLRPYRHDLCPRTIKQASGRVWECACTDHAHATEGARKRRVVKA